MTDKVKVSKWFDKWLKDRIKLTSKENIIAIISQCQFYDLFEEYEEKGNRHFNKKQHEEVREHFEEYIRAVLNGYEVEKEKTPLWWIPKRREIYWLLDNTIGVYYNRNSFSDIDNHVFQYSKVFKTKEEAEFEAEKMKVTRELEKYAREFIEGDFNYYIYANNSERAINFYCMQTKQLQGLCFESKEKAREAIKAVGEDRILKYYFGVCFGV